MSGDTLAEGGVMAESKPDWVEPLSQALVSIVDAQREHSRALTILLERMDNSQEARGFSQGSPDGPFEAVRWPTLAAILSALFIPLALVLGLHWAIISGIGEKMDYWSANSDRTLGPVLTDLAAQTDANCQNIQRVQPDIVCNRTPRPWPRGGRGGR